VQTNKQTNTNVGHTPIVIGEETIKASVFVYLFVCPLTGNIMCQARNVVRGSTRPVVLLTDITNMTHEETR